MFSLHSIMASELASKLPTLLGIVTVILLGVAFSIGFSKGFRKVSWDGFVWATAACLFTYVGLLAAPTGGTIRRVGTIIAFALLYLAGAMVFFGLLAHFIRPKMRWVKDNVNGDTSLAEYGLEFEPEYVDYDGEDDPRPYGKRLHKTGFNTPSLFGRLLGGCACMVTMLMLVWSVLGIGLLGIKATSLSDMVIGTILQNETIVKLVDFAQKVILDWVIIGLIFIVAKIGFHKGLLNSLRSIIVSVGTVALLGAAFVVPFTSIVTRDTGLFHFLNTLSNRCAEAMKRFPLSGILGKLATGACLAALVVVMMFCLNLILKKCCKMVSASAPTRIVDQVLSCGLYMVVGVVICLGIWFGFALVEYLGVLNISEIMHEEAVLANGMYDFGQKVVEKLRALI